MNKRLLLSLYDRSGLGAYMPVDLKGHELEVEEHMEKFAELIIKECIDIVSPYAIRMENFDGGHPIMDLKKHFGIE